MSPTQLTAILRSADLENDAAFREAILQSMLLLELDAGGIARELGVGLTTMDRWISGSSTPHPAMRRLLFDVLIERVQRLVRSEKA